MDLKKLVWRVIFLSTVLINFVDESAFAAESSCDGANMGIQDEVNALDGRVFIFEYENGNSFELSYSKFSLTWKGLKGPEEGKSEQDYYRWSDVAPKTYTVSWVENDGTFVNTVINLQTLKVYSSGIFEGKTWFWWGKVNIIK